MMLGLVLLLASACVANRLQGTPYPIPSNGLNASIGKLIVFKDSDMNAAEILFANTLAGAVARSHPLLFRQKTSQLPPDVPTLLSLFSLKLINTSSLADVVSKTNVTGLLPSQYVLITSLLLNESNAAMSIASAQSTPTIVVHASLESLAQQFGMKCIFNATGLTPSDVWALKTQRSWSWSSRIAMVMDDDNLADYVIFTGAFALYADPIKNASAPSSRLMPEVFSSLSPISAILGWIPGPPPREIVLVGEAAQRSAYVHCADGSINLATYSAFDLPSHTQTAPTKSKASFQESRSRVPKTQGNPVHTVALLFSDGDNTGTYDQQTLIDDHHLRSESCGKVPLGWTIAPALSELVPTLMHYAYSLASPLDEFVAGPSGLGYTYPEMFVAIDRFANITNSIMNKTDLHSVNLITGNPLKSLVDAVNISQPFLQQPQVDGTFFFNYFSYDELAGKIAFGHKNKPVVGARMWGCNMNTSEECLFHCGPGCLCINDMISILKNQVKDSSSVDGYSLISLDAWIFTVDDAVNMIDRLNKEDPGGFEFVLPSKFLARLKSIAQ